MTSGKNELRRVLGLFSCTMLVVGNMIGVGIFTTPGRIANLLAANWDDAAATTACFHRLLVDSRGCRSGFPPNVTSELLTLQRYFAFWRVQGDSG